MTVIRVLTILVGAALVLGACGELGRKTTAPTQQPPAPGQGSPQSCRRCSAHGSEPAKRRSGLPRWRRLRRSADDLRNMRARVRARWA